MAQNAITFDDFIPLTISILENHPLVYQRYVSELRYVFLDEAQDSNLAQVRLIELLVGNNQADLTVIGDPDQNLYSWRGSSNFNSMQFRQGFQQ